jgi:hypothetical protein
MQVVELKTSYGRVWEVTMKLSPEEYEKFRTSRIVALGMSIEPFYLSGWDREQQTVRLRHHNYTGIAC